MIKNAKRFLKKHTWAQRLIRIHKKHQFPGSEGYWKERYASGGNSGSGSYDKLAEFKAHVLNSFVQQHNIMTVIEFGCGDGNQLKLANYPQYLGFDVSSTAIQQCQSLFEGDLTKQFKPLSSYIQEKADLSLSLDVIYHLIEDAVFMNYMSVLFDAAERFVIIYSSNSSQQLSSWAPHVRHRQFTDWVDTWRKDWHLTQHISNIYPYRPDEEDGSFADFYIFTKDK